MSRIENTRLISAVYCDCKKCFHSVNKNGMLYCKYYDLFSPKKKKCARYSFLDKGKKKRISPKEKPKRVKKEPTFPWETPYDVSDHLPTAAAVEVASVVARSAWRELDDKVSLLKRNQS